MKFYFSSRYYTNVTLIINFVIIVLSLIWSSSLLKTLSMNRPDEITVFLIISIAFPVCLIAFAIIAIARIFMARRARMRGSLLRLKLVGAFSLIIIVTALPLFILAMMFLNTAINQWLAPGIERGLRRAENLALDYYDHVEDFIESIIYSNYIIDIFSSEEPDLDLIWDKLQDVAPNIDAMYVVAPGIERKMGVESSFDYLPDFERYVSNGLLPRQVMNDETVFYGQRMLGDYRIILSTRIPAQFEIGVRDISLALANWWYYDGLEENLGFSFVLFGLILFGPLILLVLFIALSLSERIINSLLMLSEATARISEGNFNFRIHYSADNELDFLMESFNHMITEMEENRLNTVQSEAVAAWQLIARKMAHEIRNPLTPIKLTIQRLRRRYVAEELNEKLMDKGVRTILREVGRLDGVIKEFLLVAGVAPLNKKILSLSGIVRESIDDAKQNYARLKWVFYGYNRDIIVNVDSDQIKQVLLNLFSNSVAAGATEIAVAENLIMRGSTSYVRLQIRDNGKGMESEKKGTIFHPYKSTHSSGLGLAVAQRIIDGHRGKIWFESKLVSGAVFYIELPEVSEN